MKENCNPHYLQYKSIKKKSVAIEELNGNG